MSEEPKVMDSTEWGLLVLLSVLWGGAFFFAGVALKELPPLIIVFVRVALGALFLLPLFWFYGHKLPSTVQEWMPFFVMGLVNNVVPFYFQFVALTIITVGLISIINAMAPLFTVIVLAGFGDEKLTLNRVVGVVLGVLGVAVLRGIEEPLDGLKTLGIGLGLVAPLSYGFAALWGRRHLRNVAPLKSATCQLICSGVVMLFVVVIFEEPWALEAPTSYVWLSLIGLTLFGTALAYIVFFEILVRAGPSNVMLVTLLIPVSAIFLGAAFLDEPVSEKEIVGALIIGMGLLFVDGRIPKAVQRRLSTRA
jgi:drug/metabolite transporter (DMT)-like permease